MSKLSAIALQSRRAKTQMQRLLKSIVNIQGGLSIGRKIFGAGVLLAAMSLCCNAQQSISLCCSTNISYGQQATLTATLEGISSGTVTLYNGGTVVTSVSFSTSSVTLIASSLPVGTNTLDAVVGGTGGNLKSNNVTVIVSEITPTITWPTPAAITYGTSLSGTQLDATANTSGSFTYTPPLGTLLTAGSHTLSVAFTSSNPDYNNLGTASVTLVVNKANSPAIAWSTPAPITYGTPLSSAQLNATVSGGSCTSYSPAAGTVLPAGSQTLSVNCTPNDTTDYNPPAPRSVALTVNKASLVVTANNANRIDGISNPTFSATYSGFQNGDTAAVLGGTPSLTTTATSASLVGWYPISAAVGTLTASNYSFSFAGGILKIVPAPGEIDTVVGDGVRGSQNNDPATTAQLNNPSGVGFDAQGNLYVADLQNNLIREVNLANGNIITVAGSGIANNGTQAGAGDGGSATLAKLYYPTAVATDSLGNLYIADEFDNVIRKVTTPLSGGTISLYAGSYTAGFGGDGGEATAAELYHPMGLAFDAQNNLYIADATNNRIRMVPGSTFVANGVTYTQGDIYTVAGGGTLCAAPQRTDGVGDGCTAAAAQLCSPYSVAFDSHSNLLIADSCDNRIREIASASPLSAGIITTVAGSGTAGYSGDGGLATSADMYWPTGVAVDGAGSIYVLSGRSSGAPNPANCSLRKVFSTNASSPSVAGKIFTLAGNGICSYSGDGGVGTEAELSSGYPTSIAIDSLNNVYIPDEGNLRIREVGYSSLLSTTITWVPPASIQHGILLSSVQLDATTDVPSTCVYTPGAGTKLPIGTSTLSVTCTPTDTTDFIAASATVPITVTQAIDAGTITLTVNGIPSASASYGNGSTPDTIAQALVASVSSYPLSPVNLSESDGNVYMAANSLGVGGDLNYTFQTTWDAAFADPSFIVTPGAGTLEGGASTGTALGTLYSYSIPSFVPGSQATGYSVVGNVVGYTDKLLVPGTSGTLNQDSDAWTFPYDTLNRLTQATGTLTTPAGQTTQNFCWNYDAFGNRTLNYAGTCTTGLPQTSYNSNNQLSSGLQGYDAAGDVISDSVSGNLYKYDGEGRICAVQSQTADGVIVMTGYLYNADGVRVTKGPITSLNCDPTASGLAAQPSNETDYIVGPSGEQAAEMGPDGNGNTKWVHTNVWGAGGLMATYDSDGVHFYANDWLGNRRLQTDYAGVPEQTCSNLPFGDGLACSNSELTPTEHHFTGKERDTESGNDYFGARYYASSMGRFMSPDWSAKEEPVPYAKLDDPQSLNLYAYVGNNPMSGIDPNGHFGTIQQGGTAECQANAAGSGCSTGKNDTYQQFGGTAQQQNPSKGTGFWQGVSNLFHLHSWNYVKASVTAEVDDSQSHVVGAENPVVTFGTDAAGMAASAFKIPKVGPVSAVVNYVNDPSPKSFVTNGLGLIPGLDWPVGITGAYIDFFDYGIHNSHPGPQKVGDPTMPQQLQPGLPAQDGGCEAAGLPSC